MQQLEERLAAPLQLPLPSAPATVEVDERAARRNLREQVARLERELSAAFVTAFPRKGFEWTVRPRGGPRMLSLGELEGLRDDLAQRLHDIREELSRRTQAEEEKRRLVELMHLEPGKYKWVRVSREEIGEGSCGAWHVRLAQVSRRAAHASCTLVAACAFPGRSACHCQCSSPGGAYAECGYLAWLGARFAGDGYCN